MSAATDLLVSINVYRKWGAMLNGAVVEDAIQWEVRGRALAVTARYYAKVRNCMQRLSERGRDMIRKLSWQPGARSVLIQWEVGNVDGASN